MAEDKLIYYLLEKESRGMQHHNQILSGILTRMVDNERMEREASLKAKDSAIIEESKLFDTNMHYLNMMYKNMDNDPNFATGKSHVAKEGVPLTQLQEYENTAINLKKEINDSITKAPEKVRTTRLIRFQHLLNFGKDFKQGE